MNKEKFFAELRKRLRHLQPREIDEALEYYTEYLEDAGPENEAAVLAKWGSPASLASQILAECATRRMDEKPTVKRGISTVWIVILAIFASPMAVPVAVGLACCFLAAAVTALAILVALGATALGAAAMGFIFFFTGIGVMAQKLSTAVFYLGCGLFSIGFGIAAGLFVLWLGKKSFHGMALGIKKLLRRRKKA